MPDAQWFYPHTVDGIQPGDSVLVYAQLPSDRPLEVVIGDTRIDEEGAQIATAPRPLLERAQARARIEQLGAQLAALGSDADPERAAAMRQEIVSISTTHRVLSDYTALLVLETEQDYARFGIERDALGDILTVGSRGIEVLGRSNSLQLAVDGEDAGKDKAKSANVADPTASLEKMDELANRPSSGEGEPRDDGLALDGHGRGGGDAPAPPPRAEPESGPAGAIDGDARAAAPAEQEIETEHSRPARMSRSRHSSGGDVGGLRDEDVRREPPMKVADPYDGDLAGVMASPRSRRARPRPAPGPKVARAHPRRRARSGRAGRGVRAPRR